MKKEAAARGVPFAAVFAIETVGCGAAALPAGLDFADARIEPFVLRRLDTVLGREAADGTRKFLDLGSALSDAVLRHRGHAGGIEPFYEAYHLRQVRLGELDALGIGDCKRLAHGGNKAATLLGAWIRGAFPIKRRPRKGRLVDCMPLEHVACTGWPYLEEQTHGNL